MNLKLMFSITGIFMIISGLATLLFPAALIEQTLGISLPASTPGFIEMSLRFGGAYSIGLGLIAWLVRSNAYDSKARDAVALGFVIYFALHAVTSLYGQFTDTSTSAHWVAATIQVLFAVGFFIARKSSISAKAS